MAAQAPTLWEYTLVVLNEDAPQREFALNGSLATLGRDPDNHVCLPWDQRVSRRHARLRLEGQGWILEDLGSTNGTFVGEYRVGEPVIIVPGHTIRLGRTLLQLRAQEVVPAAQAQELPAVAGPPPPSEAAPCEPSEPREPVESPEPMEQAEPVRGPGIFRRALSSLGLVGSPWPASSEAGGLEAPDQQEPSGAPRSPTGHVSCTIFPLAVEIRARRPSDDGPGAAEDLRAALNGLESSEHAVAKIVEPLHNGDAWVSVTAGSGHEDELLALAGQVIDRLLQAGIHGPQSSDSED